MSYSLLATTLTPTTKSLHFYTVVTDGFDGSTLLVQCDTTKKIDAVDLFFNYPITTET